MKIVIMGYSGSGKSTLAQKLGSFYQIPVLHLDRLQFQPGWIESDRDWMKEQVSEFLQQNDSWVIDGNYSWCLYQERMEEADQIIFMNFSRWNSLYRAFKRYLTYREKTRASIADGCPEKFDWEFIRWILWDGRRKRARDRYRAVGRTYPEKFIEIRNQTEINAFLQKVKDAGNR